MNRNHVWDIICFTIADNLKKKSIYITTIVIAIICVLALPIAAYISLSPDKDKKDDTKIENVYIYDETGFENIDYESLKGLDKDYKNLKINIVDYNKNNELDIKEKIDNLTEKNEGKSVVIAHIEYDKKKTIDVNIIIPKDSKLKKSSGDKIGEYISSLLTLKKYELAAKTDDELLELMTGVNVSINILGEGKEDEAFTLIKMYLPLIFSFIVYFMFMTYGQSISNGMVTEKNSKIIELLVAHIKPRYLIVGKVLGCVVIALGQIVIWIVSFVAGIHISNIVADNLKGKEFIPIDTIIDAMRKGNVESAFSIRAIIIFVVLLLLGFLFYCIYAAIWGSFINKPDEASSVFAIYTYTNVIAFMVVYVGTFTEQKALVNAVRYIPFCAPYSSAADVLVGNITIKESLIMVLIMIICVLGILYLLSKIYEKLIFNQLSLKELIAKK